MTELPSRTSFNCPTEKPAFREYRSATIVGRVRISMNDEFLQMDVNAIDTTVDEYQITSRARNPCSEHTGQEFLGGFTEGLAAIDSHENGGTFLNLFAAQRANSELYSYSSLN